MAQFLQHLLLKEEDQSLNPQNPNKYWVGLAAYLNFKFRRLIQGIPRGK